MLFTSMEFLFLFLPTTLGVHSFLPHCARNYWLFAVSIFFYAWGEPRFVIAMAFSIVFNYFAALRIEEMKSQYMKACILALTVVVNLGILFVFKYMNFVTLTLHNIFPDYMSIEQVTKFTLPIGISFFTFQALSYVIDVYRGIPAQRKICYLGLYISLFPQLIAGPIVRYTTIMDQMEHRDITMTGFSKGLLRFLYGFNKKMLLSNVLAEVADAAFAASDLSVLMAWLGAISYTLQIYFDFSGYSEMAIGLGEMFGFHFLENFNYPYISKSITEFWRRWHISLGSWFRDYVYFPLGGSRVKSKKRLVFNLAVVWFATGIWHGANWTFLLWGILHGAFVIGEKVLSIPEKVGRHRFLSMMYRVVTLFIVILGWVLFRAVNLSSACQYFRYMFGVGNRTVDSNFLFYAREYGIILLAGILCATPLFKMGKEKISDYMQRKEICETIEGCTQLILFILSISFLVMKAHNPFIYFNF